MILTEFRTDDYPREERFGLWRDITAKASINNTLHSDHARDFRASARQLDLGSLWVSSWASLPVESIRTPRMVRQTEAEYYQVALAVRGGIRMSQGRRETAIGPGEMMLIDASRPWQGWIHADGPTAANVIVQLPRALLPIPYDRVERLAAVRLPGGAMDSLLSGSLTELMARAGEYRTADRPRLATLILDILTAWCAHHLDAAAGLPGDDRRRHLQTRVHTFIERHLGDPGLSPATIAAAHEVSPSYLHRLFREQGMTVAGRIRERRLEQCHRDLANPRLTRQSVAAIAGRWGFADAAHFSRLFRAAYGVPPRDHRHFARQERRFGLVPPRARPA